MISRHLPDLRLPYFQDPHRRPPGEEARELVLWSARRFAAAWPAVSAVEQDLVAAHRIWGVCLTGNALSALLQILLTESRPAWRFARAGSPTATPDESALLALLAVLQEEDTGSIVVPLDVGRCGRRSTAALALARCYASELAAADVRLPSFRTGFDSATKALRA